MLVKGTSLSDPIVIAFPFLVKILARVYQKLSHIGRDKLMHIVKQYFYHPALEKVARDLCRSCKHCQLFKTNNQPIAPPILKIVTRYPFDLLAIDLLLFPRSKVGML